MAKNLDGIKKLDPEEIKKNRKIVLSYIGEREADLIKEPETKNRAAPASNKVDGIKSNKTFSFKAKIRSVLDKPKQVKDSQPGKQEKIDQETEQAKNSREKLKLEEKNRKEKLLAEESLRLEKERAMWEKIKKEELAKKEIVEKAKHEVEEKAEAEQVKNSREKFRLENKIKQEERIIEENKHLEKIKREEEIKKMKQEAELFRSKAAVKRKIKRQKAVKKFKKRLKHELKELFYIVRKNFIYGILYFITFLIISYIVFCLIVLRFKVDNNIIGEIGRILPVPAVITNYGIINYNDFRDIGNNFADINSADKKISLTRWVILKNLSKKYGLPVSSPNEVMAAAFIADGDFNQVGLSRIKKISELLKNVDDVEKLSKYADEFGDVAYYNDEGVTEKFGQAVFNLNDNQISDIIFSDNGYYIIQTVDNNNGRLGIKHLFVEAKTLDQYISEKSAKIKVFILAN